MNKATDTLLFTLGIYAFKFWVQFFFQHFKNLTLVMSLSILTTFSMFAPVPSRKGRPSELLHFTEGGRTDVRETQSKITNEKQKKKDF